MDFHTQLEGGIAITNKDKQKILRKYHECDAEIDAKIQEIAMWWDRATKITPTYSDMPKGGGSDKIQSAIDMITMLQEDVNRDIDRLIDLRKQIDAAIAAIPDQRKRQVLRHRYIDQMQWNKIAEVMNYDIGCRYVYKLHGYALSELELSQNWTLKDTCQGWYNSTVE